VPVALIIDDSDANRKLARVVLRADGFETVEAATGAEGISLAIEHVPDVILMDLRLPDMDGAEAARAFLALTQFDVEQMLLFALTRVGDAFVLGAARERFHVCRASESSMTRAQSSG